MANQVFTTEGRFKVTEFFGEVTVPILADVTFADSLELNLQARSSDYSNFGEESVWRVGINWQIMQDVRLRANRSTAYRAPSVTDLFSGGVVSFDFFSHPCAAGDPSRTPGSNVDQNCLLDGVGPGISQVASQSAVLRGGNPDLLPETADTSTIGLVLTPRFLPGFSATVDLWSIKILGGISGVSSDSIVDNCYEGGRGIDGSGVRAVRHGRYGRGAVGREPGEPALQPGDDLHQGRRPRRALRARRSVRHVRDRGPDGHVHQGQLVLSRAGQCRRPGLHAAHQGHRVRTRRQGRLGLHLADAVSPTTWATRVFDGDNAFGYDTVPSHTEHDIRVGWNPGAYRVLLGVNDLFDNDPPYVFSSGTNTDLFLYGAVGRYVFLRVNFYQ